MLTDQEIVDMFAMLITGNAELPQGDPRITPINITILCLEQFVGMTRFAYENGLLETTPQNGFEPKFVRPEDKQ